MEFRQHFCEFSVFARGHFRIDPVVIVITDQICINCKVPSDTLAFLFFFKLNIGFTVNSANHRGNLIHTVSRGVFHQGMFDFNIGRRRFFFILTNKVVVQIAVFVADDHTKAAVGITAEDLISVHQFTEMIIVFHQMIQLTSGHCHLRSIVQFVNDVFHNNKFGAHRAEIISVYFSQS